jgi:O-antigen ligase
MDIRSELDLRKVLAWGGFLFLVISVSWLVLFQVSLTVPLLACGLAVLLIFIRPVIGLALYMFAYPLVPSDASITPLKTAMLGLTLLLLFVWVIQKMRKRERFFSRPEYMWMYLFFLFLCVSPILSTANDFTLTDWARDIAPMLNLLLVPVIVDYVAENKYRWLLHAVFVLIGFSVVRDMMFSADKYGFPVVGLSALTSLPLPYIHPSLGFGLGIIMFKYRAAYKRYWLILAIVSLAVVFLSHTRTDWITAGTMVLLIVLFSSRRRLWTMTALTLMVGLVGLLILYSPGSSDYIADQRVRVSQLEHYREDPSAESRIDEIKQTAALFEMSPLYGVGFGYEYCFWRHWTPTGGAGYMNTNFTHNDIMFIASKGGAIGLFFFLMMLFGFSTKLYRRRKEEVGSIQSAWATFGIMALINSVIIGLSTPFYQTRSLMFILVVLLAMGLGYKEPSAHEQ